MYRDKSTDRQIMKFGFYNTSDPNREIINSGIFQSSEDAVAFFAAMKGLAVDTFINLFTITRITDGKF